LIDPLAEIREGVQVGPFAVIDGPVQIGPNCHVRAHSVIIGPLTMGQGNDVGVGVVLGERPQHLQFDATIVTRTEIGDHNVFREGVTVHRGSNATGVTRIGNHNYLMANCHVGHDARLHDHTIVVNGALVAGHVELHDRAFVSGNAALHQFIRMGRLSFLSGNSSSTKDILPFVMVAERDRVVGINKVGMRRAGMSMSDVQTVKLAFRILFLTNRLQKDAVQELDKQLGQHPIGAEILQFIRSSKRGFLGAHHCETESDREAA